MWFGMCYEFWIGLDWIVWYGSLPSTCITGPSCMGWWGGWVVAVSEVHCSKSSQFPVA